MKRKISSIRSSPIKRKTFNIGLTSCSEQVQRIAQAHCVKSAINGQFLSWKKIPILKQNLNLLWFLVGCHIVFRTCCRSKWADTLSFEIIILPSYATTKGCKQAQWACPLPFLFASVKHWMLPSTPLNICAFLKHNGTKTLQRVARLQSHWKDALFKLALVTETSMNHNKNHHYRIWNTLTTAYGHVLCCSITPGCTGFFQGENPAKLRRKSNQLTMAEWLSHRIVKCFYAHVQRSKVQRSCVTVAPKWDPTKYVLLPLRVTV